MIKLHPTKDGFDLLRGSDVIAHEVMPDGSRMLLTQRVYGSRHTEPITMAWSIVHETLDAYRCVSVTSLLAGDDVRTEYERAMRKFRLIAQGWSVGAANIVVWSNPRGKIAAAAYRHYVRTYQPHML